MLTKVNGLKPKQAAYVFMVLGFTVFFTGLNRPFQGDDGYQIVNNTPVHSIKHIVLLFHSGTFYNGQRLTGIYYRPMMSATFSLIYTFFGAHPIAYHLVQLALYIASAFILYLVFRLFLKQALALFLALIFLVHPLNSQVVFAIPSMQDALFFFFGILGLWVLMADKSTKSLWAAGLCFLLSLLSKETAVIFVVMAFLYLFLFERKRIYEFAKVMAAPVLLYMVLKINAVGLDGKQNGAPIDNLHLLGRLMNDPSIILFYITKFVFPWKLATGYYWTYSTFSFRHVLLPLIVDLAVAGLFIYLGLRVHGRLAKAKYRAYLFFAGLAVISLLPYLQIIPLDMTVCEDWFYPSMAGVLGMIGIASSTFKIKIRPAWLILLAILLVGGLGIRTAVRGTDYKSQYVLAMRDLTVSKGDYSAMNDIAEGLTSQGKFKTAAVYAQHSADIYPTVSNYNNLGVALQQSGNYEGAMAAYNHALKYGSLSEVYENLGQIELVYGRPPSNFQFFQKAINAYPQDYKLWLYIAILEGAEGTNASAKAAIANAAKYGPIPQIIYYDIMNNHPFTLPILNKTLLVR
jgi:tetratricopeptide (TPR) repeat protein